MLNSHRFIGLAVLVLAALCTTAPAAEKNAIRGLMTVVPEVKLDAVALRDAVDYIRDMSGLNIHVNWKALELINVGPDTSITLHVRRVTMARALDLILREAADVDQVAFFLTDNVVEITTREIADTKLVTRVYPVGDLLIEVPDFTNAPSFDLSAATDQGGSSGGSGSSSSSNSGGGLFGGSGSGGSSGGTSGTQQDDVGMSRAQRIAQLIDLITTTIRPDVWRVNGGTAAITVFQDNLVVTAPASIHAALSSRYGVASRPMRNR